MKDRFFSFSQNLLLQTVHGVETLDERKPIYKDASAHIEVVNPDTLYPTAKYVLRENLERVNKTREVIGEAVGQDLYYDPLFIKCRINGQRVTLAPPIVEEHDGKRLIVDGIHRCFDSRMNGKRIAVVVVSGTTPPIGLPVSWDEVKVCDTKPETASELRNLHPMMVDDSNNLRKHFRDFSRLGSSGRRPRMGQHG